MLSLRQLVMCSIVALALWPEDASAVGVRVVHEPDGSITVTNRSRAERSRPSATTRVVVQDGAMTVRITSGPIVTPVADRGQYDLAFEAAAQRHELPIELIKAVARAESGFDHMAVSHAGAQGLMQIMPATARALNVIDPFDPGQSIEGGARYLRKMLDRFGELELALAAYNAGPEAVERHGGIPPFEETRLYVRRVLGLFESWSAAAERLES